MNYTPIENQTWELLINSRKKTLANEACDLYLTSLVNLKLPTTYVPSHQEMNYLIRPFTGWHMIPTTELVPYNDYYKMLAHYRFPAITTIRPLQQIEYYENKDPDVVHEYFGHGPFLTHPEFSTFMHDLAKFSLTCSSQEQILLGRLFWYTTEFGLIQTDQGLRAYGAGIIPSQEETQNALYGNEVERRKFNLVDILRTPILYSKQQLYYVIDDFNELFQLNEDDLSVALSKAVQYIFKDIQCQQKK